MKNFQHRIKLWAEEIDGNEQGTISFILGQDYHPGMTNKQAETFTMFENLNIKARLKKKIKTSIMENLVAKLEELRAGEKWTHKETADNFALLLDPEKAMEEEDSRTAKDKEEDEEKSRKRKEKLMVRINGIKIQQNFEMQQFIPVQYYDYGMEEMPYPQQSQPINNNP